MNQFSEIGSLSAAYFNVVSDDFSERKKMLRNVKKEKKYRKRN